VDFHVERLWLDRESMISKCRGKGEGARRGNEAGGLRAIRKRSTQWEISGNNAGENAGKKKPAQLERAESISGGDMEETVPNIHIGLVRRNNFLRENPISCEILAVWGKTPGRRAFCGAFNELKQ
jgi:hypothetical protein